MNSKLIRLKEIPAFTLIEGLVGVGWFDDTEYFTFIIEYVNSKGENRKTFVPTRGKKSYKTKEEAIKATTTWLSTSLI